MSRNRDTLTEVCHAIVLDAPSGKTPKEIAKALGIGHSAVRNRIFRARKELEAMLRGKGVSLA